MPTFTLANDGNSIAIKVSPAAGGIMLAQDNDLIYISVAQLATLVAAVTQKKVASR
jgi:hypothetical protein